MLISRSLQDCEAQAHGAHSPELVSVRGNAPMALLLRTRLHQQGVHARGLAFISAYSPVFYAFQISFCNQTELDSRYFVRLSRLSGVCKALR